MVAAPRPGRQRRPPYISSRIFEVDPVTVPPNPYIVGDPMIMLPALTMPRCWIRETSQFRSIATSSASVDWTDRSYLITGVRALRPALLFDFRIESQHSPNWGYQCYYIYTCIVVKRFTEQLYNLVVSYRLLMHILINVLYVCKLKLILNRNLMRCYWSVIEFEIIL